MKTQIILADDHTMMREGLSSIIQKNLDMTVVAQAPNGRTALILAKKLRPDIVIMDVNMPDMNGVDATLRIRKEVPEVKVIALSMHNDRKLVFDMLNAGASAYLLKHCAVDELGAAIAAVLRNHMYVSPEITSIVVSEVLQTRTAGILESSSVVLTSKEREVLQLLAEGKSTKEISYLMGVSIPTVESHRQHLMEKLNIHTVAGLTKYAVREGLTSLD